ncbi:MAG: winged helix-turn-helix domain-containing protein [Paracoccus sp. (in: a-proteobacteria)]|nr:winged helix-turn-helix domain-containing protein [Paracoccus sp. (in: a-proteobacteria)]
MVDVDKTQERFLNCLSALSNRERLSAFKLLVQMGSQGMAAGDICRELGVKGNTMSSHLKILLHSELVFRRREGRTLRYFANMHEMGALMRYLYENCCAGMPARRSNEADYTNFLK